MINEKNEFQRLTLTEPYLISLDPTHGSEQQGLRPVLVASPTAFNNTTNLPVILPITSGGEFARRIGFAVPIAGVRTTGVVRCDQPCVLDIVARGGRRVDCIRPGNHMVDWGLQPGIGYFAILAA